MLNFTKVKNKEYKNMRDRKENLVEERI